MGIEKSKLNNYTVFNSNQYNWFVRYPQQTRSIAIDLQTKIQADMQYLKLKQNLQKELNIYQFRKKHAQFLVTVYQIEGQLIGSSKSSGCMKLQSHYQFKIYVQKIPFKLSDLGQISYSQCLYILSQIIKGAKLIFDIFQGRKVIYDDQMIGFNQSGFCKIWVNQSFQTNQLQSQQYGQYDGEKANRQSKIIQNLFDIVQWRIPLQESLRMKKQRSYLGIQNFEKAIDFIQQLRRQETEKVTKIKLPGKKNETMAAQKQKIALSQVRIRLSTQYDTQQKTSQKSKLSISKFMKSKKQIENDKTFFKSKKQNITYENPYYQIFNSQKKAILAPEYRNSMQKVDNNHTAKKNKMIALKQLTVCKLKSSSLFARKIDTNKLRAIKVRPMIRMSQSYLNPEK